MNYGHAINSGYHPSTNNSSEDCDQDNNDHSECDDEKGNHRHTPYATNEHGIVLEKWTSSQARKTSDAQSKVYSTGRKKRGGIDDVMLVKQRMQQVRNTPNARRTLNVLGNRRRVRRVESETSDFPGKDEEGTTEKKNYNRKKTPQRKGHNPATQKS